MGFSSDKIQNQEYIEKIVAEDAQRIIDSSSVKNRFKNKQIDLNHGISSSQQLKERLLQGNNIPTGDREIAAGTISD